MAKYKRKPKEIEVYKYEGSSMSSNECDYYPYWVENALKDGTLYYVEEDNNALYCCTIDGFRMKVEIGYYIVKLPDNSIATCSEEYLNKQYELIEEDMYKESAELWSWNEMDNENWSHGTFDSREEAIEDALADIENVKRILCTDTPTIYLGKCEYIPLRTDLDPDRAMEYLDEAYCDDSGCDYYIYEGVTDEQRQWLEDKLSDVMVEFHKMIGLKPCWFRVVEQEEIDLCEYQKEKKVDMNNWIPIDGKHELPTEKQQCFITVWEDWSYGKGTQISIDVDWGEFVLKDSYIPVGDNGEGFDTFNDWKEGQPVKVLAWMPFKEGVDIDEISDEELFELLDSVEPYEE